MVKIVDLKIDVRSHHFKVYDLSRHARGAVNDFARRLIHWGYIRRGRNFERAPLKVFAAANASKTEYRFHIHSLNDFIEHLKDRHIPEDKIIINQIPLREIEKIQIPVKAGWVPKENQIGPIEYIKNDNGPRQRLVILYTGGGKAQPLDSGIFTPNGWKTMGDMSVGTEVYTKSGEITKVNGVFPKGFKDIYRFTFQDGRQTECCLDHLWEVYCPLWDELKDKERVLDTKTIIDLLKNQTHSNELYIPLPEHPKAPVKNFDINPYTMGVLLSESNSFILNDGSRPSRRFNRDSVFFNTLTNHGLDKTNSTNKFIPEDYINASFEQKIELLNGLLDTDGIVGEFGSIGFSTTSLKLANQIQYLVRSIGGLCQLVEGQTLYTRDGVSESGLVSYRLNIRYKNPKVLFTLPRKKDLIPKNYQCRDSIRLRIESVEFIGRKPAQCISVEHDSHLYITDNFIVTHNSFISMYATAQIENKFIMVAKPMYLDKWYLDIKKTYDIPDEDILIIKGGASLMALMARAKSGELTEKVILISNKTMQIWLNTFDRFGKEILEMGYDVTPDDFYDVLGGGIRIIDEVHQDFHLNFKMDLYTHTERSVSLTATLLSDDPFITSMHDLAYPRKDRYVGNEYKPYINTIALMYQFERPEKIKYLDYSGKTYTHHAFEQSVIKQHHVLQNYLKMILDMVKMNFVNNPERKPGDRFIVFCASIDLCTRVTDYLSKHLSEFSIKRYVEDDPYSNLLEPVGRVSTLQSAGTAVDIDQLYCTILTTAVNSSPSNVQGFGRLRQLKDGRSPIFVYFNHMDNPKHMGYHENKKEIIKPKSKNFKEINYGKLI